MENANKQICRLCLEVILDGDCEVIEESKKEILDILLIKIDFDIIDNAVSCKKCLVKLQNCYDFKSNCFYMNDYITPFVDGDVKVDIKNVSEKVTMTSENVSLDNSQICRLCKSFIEDETFNCYTSDLKDMLENCFPEVNLNSVDEPLVCKLCLSNVTRYYEFTKSCEEVEQKIKNYIQDREDHDIGSKVILEDILELKNCGTFSIPLEKQCLDVENETECLKNEEAGNIKGEEIEIKNELDIDCDQCTYSTNCKEHLHGCKPAHQRVTIRQMYKCNLCDYQAKANHNLKNHTIKMHMDPSKVQTLRCSFCPYKSNIKSNLSQHIRKLHVEAKCGKCDFRTRHKENLLQHMKLHESDKVPRFKCDKCEYSTWRKRNFKRHQVTHMELGRDIAYKCKLCDYQAKANRSLKNHMIKMHMDPSKVPAFKCALCPYESTVKDYLSKHITRHHNHKDQLTFECMLCPYVTNVKDNLRKHSLTHEFICTIKCDQCDFRTKQKRNLQQHMKLHEPVKPPMLKCDKCEYSTWQKGNFKKHKVTHMKLGQDIAYKCKLCDYQTKTKRNLKNHMIAIHTDPSKMPKFKCALCPYEGTAKSYLSQHIKRWHSHKDQSTLRHMKLHGTVKSPTFKCDKCEYSTWRKSHLNLHKLRHMELSETIAYTCAMCDHQTKYKFNLRNHIRRCCLKKKNDKKSTIG